MREKIILLLNILLFPILLQWLEVISKMPENEWIRAFWYLIIVSLSVQISSILLLKRRDAYISLLFLIMSYLFHLSHIFLITINYNYGSMRTYIPFLRVGVESAMRSMEVSWLFIYGVFGGIILALNCKKGIAYKWSTINYSEMGKAEFGIFLVIVSLPFWAYNTGRFMFATITQGYAYAANMESNTYVAMFANMMLPGFILWMASYTKKRKDPTLILILGIVMRGIAMLTGQRAYNLMYMVVMILVYFYVFWRKRLRKRHIIYVGIAGYLMCDVLAVIRNVRSNGMSLKMILNALTSADNNAILDMISEFAITSNIVAYTYQLCEEPSGGKQIFAAFASLIPGISYLLPGIEWKTMNVIDALDAWNWGGSFVADFYFDYHYWGIGLALLWGFFFQKWTGRYIKELTYNNMYTVAWMSPILCEIFFCVRSTTYKIPRTILLYTLIYFGTMIIYVVLKRLQNMRCVIRGERKDVKQNKE